MHYTNHYIVAIAWQMKRTQLLREKHRVSWVDGCFDALVDTTNFFVHCMEIDEGRNQPGMHAVLFLLHMVYTHMCFGCIQNPLFFSFVTSLVFLFVVMSMMAPLCWCARTRQDNRTSMYEFVCVCTIHCAYIIRHRHTPQCV